MGVAGWTACLLSVVMMCVSCKITLESGMCPNHSLHDPISNRTYVIPDTLTGQTFDSQRVCMANGLPFVNLKCLEDRMFGAQWSRFEPNQGCNFTHLTTSPLTSGLMDLLTLLEAETPVTPSETASMTSAVTVALELVKDHHMLTSMDVIYIADIIQTTIQRTTLSAQDARAILEITNILTKVDDAILQESRRAGNATNRIVMAVECLGGMVPLHQNGTPALRLVTESVAFEVWDLTRVTGDMVIGLEQRLCGGVRSRALNTNDLFTLFDSEDGLDFNRTDVAIVLPADFLRNITEENKGKDVRLTLGVFADTTFFQHGKLESRMPENSDNFSTLNTKVISAAITVNGQPITDLAGYNVTTVFLPYQTYAKEQQHLRHTRCVFWDFAGGRGMAAWSDEGCTSQDTHHYRDVCQFNHLTNFAVLMDVYGQSKLPEEHEAPLSIITIVGLSLSIAGLSLTVLAFIRISKLRQGRRQKVLFNLALSMLLSWVIFLAGFTRRVHAHALSCQVAAGLLHYMILASFMWMLMEGVLQYLLFVKVFNAFCSNFVLKTMCFAWGVPVLPVIAVLAIDPRLYLGADKYCWMSKTPFYYAFLLPVAVTLAVNTVIYVLVMTSLCREGSLTASAPHTSVAGRRSVGVRASFACFVVLGLSWVFAFFAISEARLVFQYLFTVTTSLQGLFIFLLFTARDSNVRNVFQRLTRRPLTSSRTTNSKKSSSSSSSFQTSESAVPQSTSSGFK